ncbi:hypothetical protein AXG93_3340s1090 [Marchantia polymorpha subsp. ruderalis]|uniref:Uncharacterized protein n=1 Tax=Marchantia polymorpha subsp. ruderalis TaxID=1480154 RepID=A0A176VTZ6_MARPO|nr:hypothetical protein AXG93_3340s1090 [Marchantia polymorpha subsp. ruderalis]
MLGLGAVLTQCDDEGKEFVVAYACRSNNAAESREDHLTSYSSQRVDGQSSDLEVEDGGMDQRDVHDDALVLEFLRTNMVSGTMDAKERDCVQQLVSRCMVCDRVRASFNAPTPHYIPYLSWDRVTVGV